MLVVGIDPGTGVSSPLGIALFDSETREIIEYAEFRTTTRIHHRVISTVSAQVGGFIERANVRAAGAGRPLLVACEDFVLRGKGGVTLQRLIGAIFTHVPKSAEFELVQNTRVKAYAGGNGDAGKRELALAIRPYFERDASALRHINEWIKTEHWDITDALAIGVSALIQHQERGDKNERINANKVSKTRISKVRTNGINNDKV